MTSQKEQFYIQRIAELIKVNAELADKVAKLSKNSSNSSKPPSSYIVKPPKKKKSNSSHNIGGQPGPRSVATECNDSSSLEITLKYLNPLMSLSLILGFLLPMESI